MRMRVIRPTQRQSSWNQRIHTSLAHIRTNCARRNTHCWLNAAQHTHKKECNQEPTHRSPRQTMSVRASIARLCQLLSRPAASRKTCSLHKTSCRSKHSVHQVSRTQFNKRRKAPNTHDPSITSCKILRAHAAAPPSKHAN
jgi:hypothetical protein